jgi:hypothetical protein
LSYAVVQFARNASSFLVLNRQETRRDLDLPAGLFGLLKLRDVAIRFENRVRIPVIALIEGPTAGNYDLRAVLALVNEFASPAPVAIKPLGALVERFGNLVRNSSWETRPRASSDV